MTLEKKPSRKPPQAKQAEDQIFTITDVLPTSSGISGRDQSEAVAGIIRNMHAGLT